MSPPTEPVTAFSPVSRAPPSPLSLCCQHGSRRVLLEAEPQECLFSAPSLPLPPEQKPKSWPCPEARPDPLATPGHGRVLPARTPGACGHPLYLEHSYQYVCTAEHLTSRLSLCSYDLLRSHFAPAASCHPATNHPPRRTTQTAHLWYFYLFDLLRRWRLSRDGFIYSHRGISVFRELPDRERGRNCVLNTWKE